MKYRKKPIVIEAEQWFPDHPVDGVEYPHDSVFPNEKSRNCGWMETLEGGHIVTSGDWIITGVKGEKRPCKPDIFEATYEPASKGDE